MIETAIRRPELLDSIAPDLIIADEVHISNFVKLFDYFPDTFTLGVTATPIGRHLFQKFTNIVQTIDTPELIEQGFLVPCRGYQMVKDIDGLKKDNRGDYTESSQFEFYNKSTLYDGVVENWKRFANGKKTIVFNCNIEHSDTTATRFTDQGIESYSLTSKTPLESRKQLLEDFESGKFMVLNNAGILTAGYDHPPIECILVNRATASLPLWLQMCGRGSRIYQGKTEFVVLDFGGNHSRHGLWSQPRKWNLDPPKETKDQAAPVKECPRCSAMLNASARLCQYCDYVFPSAARSLDHGEMVEVTTDSLAGRFLSDLSIRELAELCKFKKAHNIKTAIVWRVIRSRGEDALQEYSGLMGYSRGWYYNQLKEIDSNKHRNMKVIWNRN
jgi:superfamily II DNA or RNA helicase